MTLRKKILLIFGSTLVVIGIILWITMPAMFGSGFAELEKRLAQENVERVQSVLTNELSALDTTVADWASWDDTYAFIENADPEYVQSNLNDETIARLKLNLIMYINLSGNSVFAKAFDLQNKQEVPVAQSFQEHLSPDSLLLTHVHLT